MRRWIIGVLLALPLLQTEVVRADTEFPIRFGGGLLWADVTVDPGNAPLHFLVDTGANCSVIDLRTARSLDLKLGPEVTVLGVGTRLKGHWPVKLTARTASLELPCRALAIDLASLSAACSEHVDGLIGADFFRGRIVQIDYGAGKVRLLDRLPAASAGEVLPMQSRPCGFRVPIVVNDSERQWVRLDTGCASSLQWVTAGVSTEACPTKLAVGLAQVSVSQTTTRVRLGKAVFENVATGLHSRPIFPGEAGLLGNALLACFGTITLDSKAGKVILGK